MLHACGLLEKEENEYNLPHINKSIGNESVDNGDEAIDKRNDANIEDKDDVVKGVPENLKKNQQNKLRWNWNPDHIQGDGEKSILGLSFYYSRYM